jgi:hypothetical protein
VTGSSVLRLAALDLCSTPTLHKVAANGRSSSKLRLGVASRRRFLRLQQCVVSLVKIGVGVGFSLVLPAVSLELLLVASKFVRVFSVNLGMYGAFF